MISKNITKLALLSATTVFCAPAQVFAQSAEAQRPQAENETGINDIIVTARRSEESAQSIPVSIVTVSEESLRYNVVQNAGDLAKQAGSLRIVTPVSSAAGLNIDMRGQTSTGTAANDTQSVGIYMNDLFMSSAGISGSVLNFRDLERVEVLMGAQGTLYGRNVTGGVVKFVTKKPTDEYEALVTAGLGNYDRRFLEGLVNIPLSDTAAIRVLGSVDNRGGFSFDRNVGREADNQKKWNVRGALSWKPTDRFSVLLEGGYGRFSRTDSDVRTTYIQPGVNVATMNLIAQQGINGLTPAALSPIVFLGPLVGAGRATPAQQAAFGAAFGAATAALPQVYAAVANQLNAPRGSATSLNSRLRTPSSAKAYNGVLTLAHEFGDATLKSITGLDYGASDRFFNVGGGPWIPLYTNQNGSSKQWTQELQLTGNMGDRLNYSAGLFHMNRKSTDNREDSSQNGPFPFFLGQFGLGITNGSTQVNNNSVKSYAAYMQASYELTDDLTFTGGLRYTSEDVSVKTGSIQKPQAATGGLTTCIGPAPTTATTPLAQCFGTASDSFSAVTYTAGLDYTVAEDVMVYAKTSRGFKSGGLNVFSGAGAPIQGYKPETTQDYEAGIKSRFFDRKVQFNLTYYHTDYKNIQRGVSFEAQPGLILTATRNAASAKIDGIEADLRVMPLEGLVIGGNMVYTDGRYDDYSTTIVFPAPRGTVQQDLSDLDFQGLSKWVYSLNAGYGFALPFGKAHAQVNWSNRSTVNLFENDSYATPSGPAAPFDVTRQSGYGLLDASFSLDIDDWNSTVTFWGKNINNERYKNSMISLSNNGVGYAWALFGDPATYGVDWTVRF